MRATLRVKLALASTILFIVMAILLVSGIYYLTARSTTGSTEPRSRAEQALDLPAGTLLRNRPPADLDILPIIPPRRSTLRQVAAGVQTQTRSQLLTTLVAFSVGLLLAMAVLSFFVGWFVAGRTLRPLRQITERARSLSETNLHERIGLEGPRDELRELADTFDQMLARLDVAFSGQRLFVANASHELRTPLTRIRTKLDVTLADPHPTKEDLDEMASTIRDAVDRSSRLIDSLLTLARSEGPLRQELVALDRLARALIDEADAKAKQRRITVTAAISPSTLLGDPVLLEHLMRNLVENALTHNVEDGWVDLEVRTEGDLAVVHVSNGGAEVQTSAIEVLFLPLRRGEGDRLPPSSGGFGLGLAIVKAVAQAHGGRVTAEPRPGGGLSIDVRLPTRSVSAAELREQNLSSAANEQHAIPG